MEFTEAQHAEGIAREAHRGQMDLQGEDYIHHVERVVAAVSERAQPAAWLHDVVEDHGTLWLRILDQHGISLETLDAVALLTRIPGQTYKEYIERLALSGNVLALEVKRADLQDNLRTGVPYSLRQRYARAVERLTP